MDLIVPHPAGLYCPAGDFFIDPWRPVERAVITHGHSDHARWGSARYLCHSHSAPILRHRLGDVSIQAVAYGETVEIGGVRVSLHPAGHVLGSAQIRVERRGEVWVASGDYKTEDDGISAPFEPQRCHAFITESTFGLPVYRWRAQAAILADINAWWRENTVLGRASVIGAYGLGKAQRVLKYLDADIGPIACHGALTAMNEIYGSCGVALPRTHRVADLPRADLARAIVIAPPSAIDSPWSRRFGDFSDAFASGWMQIRGNRRRRGVDRGFALSDHADWPGLLQAVEATGAPRVFVTHGGADALTRYLRESGVDARTLVTIYGDESLDADASEPA